MFRTRSVYVELQIIYNVKFRTALWYQTRARDQTFIALKADREARFNPWHVLNYGAVIHFVLKNICGGTEGKHQSAVIGTVDFADDLLAINDAEGKL